MSAAKLNIDELEAGYPLFCKALRLLILKGNSVKEIEKTVCWGHLETLTRKVQSSYLFNGINKKRYRKAQYLLIKLHF